MGWFAVQLSEQEYVQVPLESKETGTKFLWQFVAQAWCSTSNGYVCDVQRITLYLNIPY
jgi:hypothetical protein